MSSLSRERPPRPGESHGPSGQMQSVFHLMPLCQGASVPVLHGSNEGVWHHVLGALRSLRVETPFYPPLCPPALVSVLQEKSKTQGFA